MFSIKCPKFPPSFPKAYIAAGTVDRTMSQIGWGTDYLTKTFSTSTAATNTTNGTTGSIVYQVRLCCRISDVVRLDFELHAAVEGECRQY